MSLSPQLPPTELLALIPYRTPLSGKHRNLTPGSTLETRIHEKTATSNTHRLPGSAGCTAHIRVRTQGPAFDHPGRRTGGRDERSDPQRHARRDEVARRGCDQDHDLVARR